jgi:hypothetical protein
MCNICERRLESGRYAHTGWALVVNVVLARIFDGMEIGLTELEGSALIGTTSSTV